MKEEIIPMLEKMEKKMDRIDVKADEVEGIADRIEEKIEYFAATDILTKQILASHEKRIMRLEENADLVSAN